MTPRPLPFKRLALASVCALALPLAHAQNLTPHNYWGASVGSARAESNEATLADVLPPGVGTTGFSSDDKDTAYKLFGGHQFNRNFAVEGGYFNLGKTRFNSNTTPAGTVSGQNRVQGLNLDLVGTLPISERFSVLGRVGAHYAQSRAEFAGTGAAAGVAGRDRDNGANVKVGLGVQYEISPTVWVRGEVERYRVKPVAGQGKYIDVASVSVVFPFGRPAPQRVAAAPMPMQMAPAPAPMPAPVVQAPPPAPMPVPQAPVDAPRRVSFAAETLFGFDAVALRPEGKAALDGFGRELENTRYEAIRVEGHTDRLGSDAYNQTLSTRRAETVKSYLVTTGKVDASRITAQGMGESQPATAAGACPDSMGRTARIACLQPDRRVDVEVTGTR